MVFVLAYGRGYDEACRRAKGLFDVDDPWSFKIGTRRQFFLDEVRMLDNPAGLYKLKEGVFEVSDGLEVFLGASGVLVDGSANFLPEDVIGVVRRVGRGLGDFLEGVAVRSVNGEACSVSELSDLVYGWAGHHPVQLWADISVGGEELELLWKRLSDVVMFEYLFFSDKIPRNLYREGFFVRRYFADDKRGSCVRFLLPYACPVDAGGRAALSECLRVVERLDSGVNPVFVFSNIHIRYKIDSVLALPRL